MKPHKHAELIKAWADGAQIEFKNIHNEWQSDKGNIIWNEYMEFRIKPEPKPDVVQSLHIYFNHESNEWFWDEEEANLQLTFNGETGELKSAEVLK